MRANARSITTRQHQPKQQEDELTYRTAGLPNAQFDDYFAMEADTLRLMDAERAFADGPGHPCQFSLVDAETGDPLNLMHHVCHGFATPYLAAYAVCFRESAAQARLPVDPLRAVFEGRPIPLCGINDAGEVVDAALAVPGQADETLRRPFATNEFACIYAHNASQGCFAAWVDRE